MCHTVEFCQSRVEFHGIHIKVTSMSDKNIYLYFYVGFVFFRKIEDLDKIRRSLRPKSKVSKFTTFRERLLKEFHVLPQHLRGGRRDVHPDSEPDTAVTLLGLSTETVDDISKQVSEKC